MRPQTFVLASQGLFFWNQKIHRRYKKTVCGNILSHFNPIILSHFNPTDPKLKQYKLRISTEIPYSFSPGSTIGLQLPVCNQSYLGRKQCEDLREGKQLLPNFCCADRCHQKCMRRYTKCHHKTDTRYTKALYQLWKLFYAEWYEKMVLAREGGGGGEGRPNCSPPPRKAKFKKPQILWTWQYKGSGWLTLQSKGSGWFTLQSKGLVHWNTEKYSKN
jgi:hypothetical protein